MSCGTSWCSRSSPPTRSTGRARRRTCVRLERASPSLSALDIECPAELRPAVEEALMAAGIGDGHVSVELVEAGRIRELNRRYRGRDEATDVLAFPVDEAEASVGPRELGDVVI